MNNKESLKNKVVFITGASSGIGRALAYQYAQVEANVILAGLEIDTLLIIEKELTEKFQKCIAVKCDVNSDNELQEAVKIGTEEFGHIDIAIANAGFGLHGKLEELNINDYKKQFETNVFGVLRTIYATLPELKKTKGVICIIGSVNGILPFSVGTSPYTMSKFAVRGLAQILSLELEPYKVSVVHAMPGFVATNFDRGINDKEKKKYSWLKITAGKAAKSIFKAIKKRKTEVVISRFGKFAVYMERYAPTFVRWISRLFAKYD